jgi:Major Facilitator Superfamily
VIRANRDFRLLFGSQAVSLLGDGMINVALAFAVLEVSGSASAVGLVFAARTLPLIASLLVGGVVADRVSRRAVMVAADLVRLAAQAAMAALLIGGAAEVWSLAVLAGIGGAATGFYAPAATGLLPGIVPPEDLQRANGMRLTAMAAGEILGPLLAAGLVVAAGAGWAIAIDAVTFAVSAALLARIAAPAAKAAGAEEAATGATSFLRDLRDGWRAVRARTWIWATMLSASLGNLFWGAWTALGPVVADRELGGAGAWGTVLAAMGVGGLAGGILAIRRPPRRPIVVFAVSGTVFAAPLALLAETAPLPLIAVAAFLSGVALMFANAVWESTLQLEVPGDSISRVSAYEWFGSLAFQPVGLALWGPVAVGIGFGAALWLAFALLVVSSLGLLASRDVRTLEAQAATS